MSDFETIAKEFPIHRINKDQFADMIQKRETFIVYIDDVKLASKDDIPNYLYEHDFPLFAGFVCGKYEGWLHGNTNEFLARSIEFLKSDEWGQRPLFYMTKEATIPFNIESLL